MFDSAVLTISGNVVADPRVTGSADSPDRVTFRVVSNRRRRDPETGDWKQVGEYGINVVCWRRLARGVAQVLRKGEPVLVHGTVTERRYVADDGETRFMTELTADFVGHDLGQGHAGRFSRFSQIDAAAERHERAAAQEAGESAEGGGDTALAAEVEDAFEGAEPVGAF